MDWHGRVYGTMECTWQRNKRIITGHYRQSDVEGGRGAEKGYSGDSSDYCGVAWEGKRHMVPLTSSCSILGVINYAVPVNREEFFDPEIHQF